MGNRACKSLAVTRNAGTDNGADGLVLDEASGTMRRCTCGALRTAQGEEAPVTTTAPASEGETLEWLNQIVVKMWPQVNKAATRIVQESVTPAIQASMPSRLASGTHFKEFTLGSKTPVFGPITVNDRPNGSNITVGFAYESDVDIYLSAVVATIGIQGLKICGEMHVVLEPLLEEMPVVGAAKVYFLNPPTIDFNLRGAGSITKVVPGLKSLITNAVKSVVASMIVLPNAYVVPVAEYGPLGSPMDPALLSSPMPLGVLRVAALRAAGLTASDMSLLGPATSDPFVTAQVGDTTWESKVVNKNLNPEWSADDFHDFIIYDKGQQVQLDVYDKDQMGRDHIGRLEPVSAVAAHCKHEQPMTVYNPSTPKTVDGAGSPAGTLTMRFDYLVPQPQCKVTSHGALLRVKANHVMLPRSLGKGQVALMARLPSGVEKKTCMGVEPVGMMQASLAVDKALQEVVVRSKEQKLDNKTIAIVTGLKEAEVTAIISQSTGGSVVGVENSAGVRKLEINAVLYMPVDDAQLSSGQELVLELVDEKGAILAQSKLAMTDVANTTHGSSPGLMPVFTSSADSSIKLDAQIEVSAKALVPHEASGLTTMLAVAKMDALAKKVVTRLD